MSQHMQTDVWIYLNRKGKNAQMHRLIWAFIAHIRTKYTGLFSVA